MIKHFYSCLPLWRVHSQILSFNHYNVQGWSCLKYACICCYLKKNLIYKGFLVIMCSIPYIMYGDTASLSTGRHVSKKLYSWSIYTCTFVKGVKLMVCSHRCQSFFILIRRFYFSGYQSYFLESQLRIT